ncbi:MAG: hypothetical protein F4025_06750 [Synechococcus sp. SB0669_bin_7]|nr:hypothetical protein [Synechococcus sp. SB0675_bin_7]MYK86089.1 hypothetical protein [Synechococcus sp. SB0669_bin_7]
MADGRSQLVIAIWPITLGHHEKAAPCGHPGGHGGSVLLALSYEPKVDAAAPTMAIPSINLADTDGLSLLPDAWERTRRWRLSRARLAQHRQRNRCRQHSWKDS